MITQRKEFKSDEFKPSSIELPDDVIQHMIPMMWFKQQRVLATTSKTATFWVARHLLEDLVDLLKLQDVLVPESLAEANKMYKDLMRKHLAMMHQVVFDFHNESSSAISLDERYLKHICNYDRKFGGFMLYSVVKFNVGKQDKHYELAKKIIGHGADLNYRALDGNTPLLALILSASSHPDRVEIVRLLLEKGADITITTKDRKSALELARSQKDGAIEAVLMSYLQQRRLAAGNLKR
ncbi:MAG: ankyrin repeat domain-containing protein [Gammaproteobacteria bacterium]